MTRTAQHATSARSLASWVWYDIDGVTGYRLPRSCADIDCVYYYDTATGDHLPRDRADLAYIDGLYHAMLYGYRVGLPPTRSLATAQREIERLIAEGWQGPEERFEQRFERGGDGWRRTSSGLLARPCRNGRTALITECHGRWMILDEHGRVLEPYQPHLGRSVHRDSFDSEEDVREFSYRWLARWSDPR